MFRRQSVLSLLALAAASASLAEEHYLFRTPALSATAIVFSYAGDLWTVPREGGDARRLTSHPGVEINPVFSPDGKTIAFSGEYDGSRAVYAVPSAGGVPKCLTWNHAQQDSPVSWTRDGKRILFRTMGNTATDGSELYTVDLDGNFPEKLPLPMGSDGSYSPDASHLAYVPLFQFEPAWKRYRGGQMEKIWIANLADSSVVPIPRTKSNDFNPMWVNNKIYFLSDRNGPVTLFTYDLQTRQVKQLMENHGFDLKSASAGPGGIVYEQFGSLGLYDIASGKAKPITIRPTGDFLESRRHTVDVSGRVRNPDISPNGARAVFEARGEIITVPSDKGDARNLTNTPGANETEPVWSPKGDKIAYFSDESGEYQLHLRDQSGMEEPQKFSLGKKPGIYKWPRWSPDATKISYLDDHLNVWYIDLIKKTPVLVDKDTNGYEWVKDLAPVWSPDSNWLAYTKTLPNRLRAIWLYSAADGKKQQVTDGMSETRYPVFDKSGRYLYFLSSTNSGPSQEVDLQALSHSSTYKPYLIVLSNDQPSPFLAESSEENANKVTITDNPIKIDFDNISQRTVALPMPARSYFDLQAGSRGFLYAAAKQDNVPDTVYRFDLDARQEKAVAAGVSDFVISANGEKMLYKKDGNWIIAASDTSDHDAHTLTRNGLETIAEPLTEWRQIYHEAWHIMRDLFYDPAYHGLNMETAEKLYAPFLDNLSSRQDLNYLLEEAFGQLTVSHLFVEGGDWPDAGHASTGLLGADYSIEQGRYRFKRVYSGENWNPQMRSPLTRPGVNVKAGEYLLAINGRNISASQNIYKAFESMADKQVVLTVGPDPSGVTQWRHVRTRPVDDEHALRYLAWIEDNRRKVDQISKGRVAYIHMPDTAKDGFTSFTRYFYAQVGKEAAIIDDRFNHGGHWATDVMDFLRRTPVSVLSWRDGQDLMVPAGIYGPKVMLINEFAGSGGDFMPWYFRQAGVGKLVGATTWGGIVGNGTAPELMDGGIVKVPCCFGWNPGAETQIENNGTVPDIEVAVDPKLIRGGHDPQLEIALEVVLQELAKHPLPQLKRPTYPKYN